MTEHISWDQALVKKYSCSNHYKLLNQLRNEVKKYPLIKKKKKDLNVDKDNRSENRSNQNKSNQNLMKDPISNNEKKIQESTISFNNSKNFSIFNNNIQDSKKVNNENILIDENNSSDNISLCTFKDRLNNVDMK